jgi:transcription initiation protein SPT3
MTASDLAGRHGVRLIGNDDLFFQIRQDPARVARLRSCIKWKNARKGIKDDDDAIDDADLEELFEEAKAEKVKMPNAPLPWDISNFFSQKPAELDQVENEEDEDEEFSLERKRRYDEVTRDMTVEEYAIFSEYRHAFFTY